MPKSEDSILLKSPKNKESDVSGIKKAANFITDNAVTNFITDKFDVLKKQAVAKLQLLVLDEHSGTIQYILFNFAIYFIILINFTYLCLTSYPISQSVVDNIIFVNIFCSGFFVMEIVFKLIVLGFRNYFKDMMNVLDFFVVMMGIVEIVIVKTNADMSGKLLCINNR